MTTKRPGLPYRRTQSLVRKWTPLPPEFPAPCKSLGRRPWWIVTLQIRGIRRVLTRNNADKDSEFRQFHFIYSNSVKFTAVYSSIQWFVWLNMIYSIHLSVCLSVLRCVVKKMQQCTKFLNIFKVTAYETHCYQIITFSLNNVKVQMDPTFSWKSPKVRVNEICWIFTSGKRPGRSRIPVRGADSEKRSHEDLWYSCLQRSGRFRRWIRGQCSQDLCKNKWEFIIL